MDNRRHPPNPAPSITNFSPGVNQNNNTQAWSHKWDIPGQFNVTYVGSNGNGNVSKSWNVTVATCSPTDVDCNGVTNEADLDIISSNFGRITYAPYPRYDVTGYGIVDIYELLWSQRTYRGDRESCPRITSIDEMTGSTGYDFIGLSCKSCLRIVLSY